MLYRAYKSLDNKAVNDCIDNLSDSDRSFILVTGKMKNIDDIYPVSDTVGNNGNLADLAMAYHYYLQEKEGKVNPDILIPEVDHFYKI